ncbi:hypothetical protein ANN_14284 [Periplaneta americana]|uniref:Uncharacterized protein n=1 Tax=Periplaneta americana TaxID=6978 RepID=A0ABQ8SVW9_PERAM|nr:hypothetical protein ANN_14284 [Periplaneta americana]
MKIVHISGGGGGIEDGGGGGDDGDNAGEMSPESSIESYPAFAHIGLRENPGKNINQFINNTEGVRIKKPSWTRWRKAENGGEKNINTEEDGRNYRKLNNELRRETDKAKEDWMKEK